MLDLISVVLIVLVCVAFFKLTRLTDRVIHLEKKVIHELGL